MKPLLRDYGMLWVLLLLGGLLSLATRREQHPEGDAAARQVAGALRQQLAQDARVLVVAQASDEEARFAAGLESRLQGSGLEVVRIVRGTPADARQVMANLAASGERIDAIACTHAAAEWPLLEDLDRTMPRLGHVPVFQPQGYWWPTFLNVDNLLNVAGQMAEIAIIAIGMTMVIITGGIDLSVGSLIALSAVIAALGIERLGGAEEAGTLSMIAYSAAAIAACTATGLFSGLMVTFFEVPPFIATLAMMLVASGAALQLAHGQSIYHIPASFGWLGGGKGPGGLPHSVVLMLALYAAAHVVMRHMAIGRYIYAVGGNREAARLSGVPVAAVLLLVYSVCGALAGLGGIIMTSRLNSASPIYGLSYELSVIAAVVVGGTSISGGEGRILGTLLGATTIAVISNGMNLLGIDPYSQKIVLGLVILGAVLLDTIKRKWRIRI